MIHCLKYLLPCGLAFPMLLPGQIRAQALETSAIEQQQGAIQDQITQGITSGTLSADQIAHLQDRIQALGTAGTTVNGATGLASRAGLGTLGTPAGETLRPLDNTAGLERGGVTQGQQTLRTPPRTQTQTGPDPFTYNTLGPDAYQSQKYQNPAYNVPAYPTTNAQSLDTQQQYSAPSAGTPYGAGYAQAPGAGGALPQVYVYHPSMSR